MVSHQWRRFAFFSKEVVKDDGGEKWSELQGVDVTCTDSGRGKLLIGDSKGVLHFVTQDMKVDTKAIYLLRVSHVVQVLKAKQNIVVTVGEDEPDRPILRVWNITPKLVDSTCVRYVDLNTLNKGVSAVHVTCIVVSDNMSNMALGLADGTVWLFYRHDITREQRYKVIHSDKAAITGLAFNKEGALFVATETAVHSYKRVSDNNPVSTFLSSEGCGLGLSLLTDHHSYHQFLIAPKNKFLFFTADDPGNNLPMDGTRSHIAWYRGCLVSVSFARRTMLKQDSICDLTIYDMGNKFIGFTGTFPPVKALLVEWGSLFVIGKNNELYKLNEKGIQEKIEILKRKCLYDDAIQLAKNNQDDHMNLIKAHGDHLASKGDHDGAISKYIGTIGHIEPSYVIRKFLDARRIHNLTQYLEALHERGVANQDHTTLLLNCYTKLKNVHKLEQFIRSEGELNFDVETAIKVCRQATYYDDAAYLAKKFNQYDRYVHIQIEDKQDYEAALDYINKLPSLQKKKENIKLFGKHLMDHLPEDMTRFLIDLCTSEEALQDSIPPDGMPPDSLPPDNMALEEYVTEQPPDPEELIPLFVNRNDCLIEFLEAIVQKQPDASSQVYNALLELYLRDSQNEERREMRTSQVVDMLQNEHSRYDPDHALLLMQLYRLQPGIVILCENRGLYQHVLDCYIENNDTRSIMELCWRRGQEEASLWIQALRYFAVREDEESRQHVGEILQYIEQKNLLPPLMVVKALSENSTTPISVLLSYITRHIGIEEEQTEENETLIKKYSDEATKMREEIKKLKCEPVIFQTNKCTKCAKKLYLPAVHLLCRHSWHQQCFEELADLEDDCPACSADNRQTVEHLKSLDQIENLDQQFFRCVENAPDPFTAVADFFAKGVYNKPLVIDGERKAKLQVNRRSRPSCREEMGVRGSQDARVQDGEVRGSQNARVQDGGVRGSQNSRKAVVFENSPPDSNLAAEIGVNPFEESGVSPGNKPAVNNPFEESGASLGNKPAENMPAVNNPFDDDSNPFADDSNPFAVPSDSKNPFAEEKNPFGEESVPSVPISPIQFMT